MPTLLQLDASGVEDLVTVAASRTVDNIASGSLIKAATSEKFQPSTLFREWLELEGGDKVICAVGELVVSKIETFVEGDGFDDNLLSTNAEGWVGKCQCQERVWKVCPGGGTDVFV